MNLVGVLDMVKTKSKDYIQGFRHGVKWALIYNRISISDKNYEQTLDAVKEAVKSLKEGR